MFHVIDVQHNKNRFLRRYFGILESSSVITKKEVKKKIRKNKAFFTYFSVKYFKGFKEMPSRMSAPISNKIPMIRRRTPNPIRAVIFVAKPIPAKISPKMSENVAD